MGKTYALNGTALRGEVNISRGSLTYIGLSGDPDRMNWTASRDDQPYHPGSNDWGLGGFRLKGFREVFRRWDEADRFTPEPGGGVSVYNTGPLQLRVRRYFGNRDELREEYCFTNTSPRAVHIRETAVFFPVNDAYPEPAESLRRRAHGHVWCGGIGSWIAMFRMGGGSRHLGMAVTEGSVSGYRIENRSSLLTGAQSRGDIALLFDLPPIAPGETARFQTVLFVHSGWDDFFTRAGALGLPVRISASNYVRASGDTAGITVSAAPPEKIRTMELNGSPLPFVRRDRSVTADVPACPPGQYRLTVRTASGDGWADLLVIPDPLELMRSRSRFIVRNQQVRDPGDPLLGAYRVYDNEAGVIIRGTEDRCDLNAGRERMGMAVFLSLLEERESDPERRESLELYRDFFLNKLLREDGTVKNGFLVRPGLDRGYNYPWAAMVCLSYYRLTRDTRFLRRLLTIIRKFYRNFGNTFAGILLPVLESYEAAVESGQSAAADELLELYRNHSDETVNRGDAYPVLEVNYEQSIVAPVAALLLEFYLVTGEEKYLREGERHLSRLELFGGRQPDFRLYDIGIRHWDGYWFGKSRMFGDTFPHHWSVLTALVFHRYWEISGKEDYRNRCWNILKANLCLFSAGGGASCAHIYPESVDGRKGRLNDPFANDQDWILAVFLLLLKREERFSCETREQQKSCN